MENMHINEDYDEVTEWKNACVKLLKIVVCECDNFSLCNGLNAAKI